MHAHDRRPSMPSRLARTAALVAPRGLSRRLVAACVLLLLLGASAFALPTTVGAAGTPTATPPASAACPTNPAQRGANWNGADLRGCNLAGFDFAGANLNKALLANARLDDARLDGANLNQADLTGASVL